MLGPRFLIASAAALVLSVAGCAAVGEPSTAVPSAAPQATAVASDTSSADPETIAPKTSKPGRTARPAKSTRPSEPAQSTGPALPNLVITKFITDLDRIVVGEPADARVTVKNEGSLDAGPFNIGVGYTLGEGGGGFIPTPVDGVPAGESVQVTVNISLLGGEGSATFTATADAADEVAESNEDDNTLTLSKTAVSLPNLALIDPPFYIDHYGNEAGWRMNVKYTNTGTADITTPFEVTLAWSSISASGTFPSDRCCPTNHGMSFGPGSTVDAGLGPYDFPTSGTYTVVLTLDGGNVVDESDETDNTATATIDVP